MLLKIVTSEKLIFEGEVKELSISTDLGQVTILKDHLPLFAKLKPSILSFVEHNKTSKIVVNTGFLEMENNQINIMTSQVVSEEDEIDSASNQNELKNIYNTLGNEGYSNDNIEELLALKDYLEAIIELKS
ncbi:MAG: ATP synthase F1 subunit epsilon [Pseudomonadota bacterium]